MNQQSTERNVLVRVDVQNDFITGSLAVNEGDQVIAPLNRLARTVREAGGQVVDTRDWHPAETPHFDTWPAHCVQDTNGAELHPDLEIVASDILLSKGTATYEDLENDPTADADGYSGWGGESQDGKTLETIIEPRTNIEKVRVFIGGLATDYCVKATALDVADRFRDDERVTLYLLRDAIRAVGIEPAHEPDALAAMEEAQLIAISCEQAGEMVLESVR